MKIRINLLLFNMIVMTSVVYSQNDSIYRFVMPELKIYDNVKKRDVNVHFEDKKNLFILYDSTLIAETGKYKYSVNINSIHKISFRNGTNFWGGAAYGAAFGIVIGFFAGGYFTVDGPVVFNLANAVAGAVVFAIPFAGVGGLIGLLSPKYDEYDLSASNSESRREKLNRILKKNRIKGIKN